MRTDSQGKPLIRSVTVKIFEPGNKRSKTHVFTAPNGKGYTPDAVSSMLATIAQSITEAWLGHEYSLVTVKGGYNFVHRAFPDPEVLDYLNNHGQPFETELTT